MSSVLVMDTDILSALMRREAPVIAAAQSYLSFHSQFTFSLITRFEILRGLLAKNATTQVRRFDEFCNRNIILPVTEEVISAAANLYADLHRKGRLINDADTLISATALVHGFGVTTNNEDHFRRVPGLRVENWLKHAP